MSLSIIIPVRNEEENILETAIKIKKFLLFEFEICFIDDFSSDKTFEVITNYIDKNRIDNIKIYKNTSPGLGPAINKGIEISSKKKVPFKFVLKTSSEFFLDFSTAASAQQSMIRSYLPIFW